MSKSWWGAPHYTVARLAETRLSPEQLKYINDILETWTSEKAVFHDTANWHDDIKAANVAIMANWHFRNQPIFSSDYEGDFSYPTTYNITDASKDCINTIMSETTTSQWILGFCFRTLSHFVADAHCPVHSAGRWSKAFPDGDRGGNSQAVVCTYGQPCRNMHMLWDSACLDFQIWPLSKNDVDEYEKNLTNLLNNYQPKTYLPETYQSTDPDVWENEAYRYASKYVYGNLPDDLTANDTYIKEGANAAKQLISAAGYRLGEVLLKFFEARKNSLPLLYEKPKGTWLIVAWVINGILICVSVVYTVGEIRSIGKNRHHKI